MVFDVLRAGTAMSGKLLFSKISKLLYTVDDQNASPIIVTRGQKHVLSQQR
ncbi:hypothetical protein AAULR_10490 [Lacticaseibacillus rhamnosus MTCC 5462]|nr:hypothetical protein AAULR_10490 [Lacticaseibacillus rhamnosus MTCC 5462]